MKSCGLTPSLSQVNQLRTTTQKVRRKPLSRVHLRSRQMNLLILLLKALLPLNLFQELNRKLLTSTVSVVSRPDCFVANVLLSLMSTIVVFTLSLVKKKHFLVIVLLTLCLQVQISLLNMVTSSYSVFFLSKKVLVKLR